MRHLRLAALLAATLLAALPLAAQDRIVFVVRHAEKAAPSGDVALSAAGEARARDLADALRDAGVDGVVVTQFRRTRDTAAPLAAARHLTPTVVQAGGDTPAHAKAVAAAVLARPAGSATLVVGHSNTVPAIVAALGGPAMPELCDAEYDGLYVLVVPREGMARLTRARFGAPDPPDADGCRRGMRQ